MAHLKPLAAESLKQALAAIDDLWAADEDGRLVREAAPKTGKRKD